MVFDSAGRVLLIRCAVLRRDGNQFVFWLTPGGEIEPGEEPLAAARREVREELDLELDVRGPVYEERNRFEHIGEMRDNYDFYFVARCEAEAPNLCGVTADEIALMQEIRWWTAEEVEAALAAGVNVFPLDLAARMQEFGRAVELGRSKYGDSSLRSE
jgi:8-oxo-dGTP pyrophosphatase MutT (NUDIX family)